MFVEHCHQMDVQTEEEEVLPLLDEERRMEILVDVVVVVDRSVQAAMVQVLGGENFRPCRPLPVEIHSLYFRQHFGNRGSMERKRS